MSTISFIDKLLDGVEVENKILGWIGDVRMCKRIMKNQTKVQGEVPFFKIGTFGKKANAFISRDLFEEYKEKYNYPKLGDVLISASGTIGRSVIFDGEDAYFQDSNIVWIENDETKILNKYLFHFYKIAKWHVSDGGVISRLYNDNIKKTPIPIPCPNNPKKSLEIQAEIVRILDTFSTLTAELTARKKQYQYYRDLLLSFPKSAEEKFPSIGGVPEGRGGTKSPSRFLDKLLDGVDVEWVALGEIATLRRGRVMSKGYLVDNAGNFPVYSSQTERNGMIGKINTFDFDGEYITWTTDGANAGTVFHRTGKFSITNVCGSIKINDESKINYKFLFYWLSIEAQKHVYSGMGNPKLMSHQVEKIPIPIPCPNNPKKSLEIQAEIVRILDKFDTLTNSISDGLPREIELRQKQYEYYRELLFSFPKPVEAKA